jgi:PD-(D/E)XK nuclease superfamily
MTTVLSHSNVSVFERCKFQFKAKFVDKLFPFVETTAMKNGNDCHASIKSRLGAAHTPLPPQYSELEQFVAPLAHVPGLLVEKALGMTRQGKPTGFFDKDVWARGRLDACAVNKDQAVLFDWKSSAKPYDCDDAELQIHGGILQAHFPTITKASGYYVFVSPAERAPYIGVEHKMDAEKALTHLHDVSDQIDEASRTGHYPPTPNPLCPWCSVKTCAFHPDN